LHPGGSLKSTMVLVTLYIKTFISLEGRDLLSRTPAEISVLQAIGDHTHLMFGRMAFQYFLAYKDSNMFPQVENHFADCEQIYYLREPIKFYAFVRQFWTEK
jgi:hypothetical protein